MATAAVVEQGLGMSAPDSSAANREWRSFANWALIWVVLANAGFVCMWAIGAPPRAPEIVGIGVLGLILRDKPVALQITGLLLAIAYTTISFVAGLFNLGISSLISSLRFFLEINPLNSIEYLIGAAVVCALVALAIWRMRKPQDFSSSKMLLLAVGSVLSLAALDVYFGMGMRGHYMRAPAAGAPFESAIGKSGFVVTAQQNERHMLIVMVESLGLPVDNAEMNRLLFERYKTSAVEQRFELTSGTTTYYNSTTAAEVRELCGRWGDYYDLLDAADNGCLPAQLRDQGYATQAIHTFKAGFFERSDWYPNVGFDEQLFAEDLIESGARRCGGVFPGACDRDVPQMIAQQLTSAERPQFLYWLTLNSHLPVPPGQNLEVDNCATVSPELATEFPMICRQFAIWDAVDAALVAEITASDFPPTDILIVGDHMPPYFDRHHRRQFAPDRVPWLHLRWRGEDAGEGEAL